MPKSLFVDPNEVRKPGQVTFNDIPVNQYNKTVAEELASGKRRLKIWGWMPVCWKAPITF